MQFTTSVIVKNHEADGAFKKIVGGKAANLWHLCNAGFNVPEWFATRSDFSSKFALRVGATAWRDLAYGSEWSPIQLEQLGTKLADLMRCAEFAKDEEQELLDAFDSFFRPDQLVAVRSSCLSEDGDLHSYAGAFETFLFVSRERLIERVKDCIASAYTPQVLQYAKSMTDMEANLSMSVVIQSMVAASKSGVMFTADPTKSDCTKLIVVAGYGVGEGVVDGRVDVDTYTFDSKNGELLSSDCPIKRTRVCKAEEGATGTAEQSVPAELANAQVLNDSEQKQLYEVGKKIETYFGKPQDVEWAFDTDGSLFVLQARPITTLRTDSAHQLFDASNVSENYQGTTTPLTYSYVRKYYHDVFLATTVAFGGGSTVLSLAEPDLKNMVGYLNGGIYYRLESWYRLFSRLPAFKYFVHAFEHGVGIPDTPSEFQHYVATAYAPLPVHTHLHMWTKIVGNYILLPRRIKTVQHNFEAVRQTVKMTAVEGLALDRLVLLYEDIQHRLANNWGAALINDYYAFIFYRWMSLLLRQWKLDDTGFVASEMMRSGHDVASVEPVEALAALTQSICGEPMLKETLISADYEALERLISRPEFNSQRLLIDKYVEQYGDRRFDELKLESPTLRDKPELLYGLMRNLSDSFLGHPDGVASRGVQASSDGHEILKEKLRGHPIRALTLSILGLATRRALRFREYGRLVRSQRCGLERQILLSIGTRLAERGALSKADDVLFLTVEETLDYVRGTSAMTSLAPVVNQRRAEFQANQTVLQPLQIRTDWVPYLQLPSETPTDQAAVSVLGTLKGTGCSAGVARGVARVVKHPSGASLNPGDILIAHSTDPAWAFLMASASGLVVERGNLLSHAAIIGRELGIPCVIGVNDATTRIRDGDIVAIDGTNGTVEVLELMKPTEFLPGFNQCSLQKEEV